MKKQLKKLELKKETILPLSVLKNTFGGTGALRTDIRPQIVGTIWTSTLDGSSNLAGNSISC
jgi:hypothetical protein